MKKIVLTLSILMVLISCKEKNTKEVLNVPEKKEISNKDNIFEIILNIKVLEDDKFNIFYVSDSEDGSFNSKEKISKSIEGSHEFQNISFELPKDILPYKIRIDIGDNGNKHESPVEFKSIKILLNNKSINIDNSTIDTFFQHNVYLQRTDNGYSRRVYNDKYDPFITAKDILIKKIELEL